MAEIVDVLIIGTGFGGSAVALRAAQAGKSVCVLERGRRWHAKDTPAGQAPPDSTPFPDMGDKTFLWGKKPFKPWEENLGLFQIKQMTNIQPLLSAGVGGGSLIWSNAKPEVAEHLFDQPGWPAQITRASMETYYQKTREFFQAQLPQKSCPRAELHRHAAECLGKPWQLVPVAANFGDQFNAQSQINGTVKNGRTYIAAAIAAGAQVWPLHVVTHFQPYRDVWRVFFRQYDLSGRLLRKSYIDGKKLVVSAGSLGTTELAYHSGIKSESLGSCFSLNGNVLDGALKRNGRAANSPYDIGPTIASMIDFGDYIVEDHANPIWATGIIGLNDFERIAAFLLAVAGRKAAPEKIVQKAHDMLVYVGVGNDGAKGRLKLNCFGKLYLEWPGGVQNEPVFNALHQTMKDIAVIHGREHIPNIFSVFNRLVTYHPLGGCPVSDDPRTGVVDSFGRVHGYQNLFFIDGSIIRSAIGHNPSETIAAFGERGSEAVIE